MAKKNVKQSVLELLGKNRERSYSGEEIAAMLCVTRAAVWKSIEALRGEGYEIEGVHKRGYRLSPAADLVNAGLIAEQLSPEAAAFYAVECLETVSSTNTILKERASAGAAEGSVLIAEQQTAGRGRMGRQFYSPKGSGIYLSVLLRPDIQASDAILITTAAAAAGAEALETAFPVIPTGAVQIKWVNDLFLNDHKISGILTEGMLSMESGRLDYAVLGIGFNLAAPEGGWPEELRRIAGGLPEGTAGVGARARVAAEFLNRFLPYYRGLAGKTFLPAYRSRQLLPGRQVLVEKEGAEPRSAEVLGIDDNCRLLVRFAEDGAEAALSSGEVRVKPQGDSK